MPSERVQRQIDELLSEAEAAIKVPDWERVRDLAKAVIGLDDQNEDARAYLKAAQTNLAEAPPHRRQASEVEPRWEVCHIAWNVTAGVLGQPLPWSKNYFWAQADSPVSGAYCAGVSSEFDVGIRDKWTGDHGPRSWDENAVRAFNELRDSLLGDGWEPSDFHGSQWWGHTYRRQERTEEDGFLMLRSVPKWDDGRWVGPDQLEDEIANDDYQEALRTGRMRQDADGYWSREEFFIELSSRSYGAQLVGNIKIDRDGSHGLTFRRNDDETQEPTDQ